MSPVSVGPPRRGQTGVSRVVSGVVCVSCRDDRQPPDVGPSYECRIGRGGPAR